MDDIELIFPTNKYKKQIERYKNDMLIANSSMDGCGSLKTDDFDTWLKKCEDWQAGRNLPDGYVPSTQLICVRKLDNKVIGMLQIRHELNDFLLNYGGHVGGSTAPDERNKGYGKRILTMGIKKCKEIGIKKILITCKDTNYISRKCIISNGGKYEDTRTLESQNINLERYWIES